MVIITGFTGQPHITAEQTGATNAGMVGNGQLVFDVGEKFDYELVSNNEIHIKGGYGINQGRLFGTERNGYDVLNIETGTVGQKRRDLIVARYEKDESNFTESVELIVVKGTAGDDYVTPEIEEGNILDGANISDFPLYQIDIDGISVSEVKQLFQVNKTQAAVAEELSTINEELGNKQSATDENLETESKEVVGAINELNSELTNKGSATKGVYFDADGHTQPMTYSLNKDVPSNAVFTDTTYDFEGCVKVVKNWFYNLTITATVSSGQTIEIFTNEGVISLNTSGGTLNKSRNNSYTNWTSSTNGLKMILNTTVHQSGVVIVSNYPFTLSASDTNTPQSNKFNALLYGAVFAKKYEVTTGTSGSHSWSVNAALTGYTPIGYTISHGNSAVTMCNAEGWQVGNTSISGYCNTGGLILYVNVQYVKNEFFANNAS